MKEPAERAVRWVEASPLLRIRLRGPRSLLALSALLLVHATRALAGEDPFPRPTENIVTDTVWEGRVLVERKLIIAAAASLTVRPGAEVRFRDGAGLVVEGTLLAEATTAEPILFLPAGAGQEVWDGIALVSSATVSRLADCRIRGARALVILRGSHRVERCEISGGLLGVEVNGDTALPELRANRFHDLRDGGIRCVGKSAPRLEGNTFERCGPFGIHASQGAVPLILDNVVSGCGSGIDLVQSAPYLRGNRVRECGRGIVLSSAGGGKPVQGNTVETCDTGFFVQQFSAPELAENTVAGNREGIVCHMGARPLIRNNAIRENETGIVCNQLAAPTIEANAIERNRRGVFLNLSSYAAVRGNNFEGNDVHLELGNMSRDWERRVGKKPRRGLQQQTQARVERGLAAAGVGDDDDGLAADADAIDAAGNWWGEATTREMEEKGHAANIGGLRDWHDVPTLTYEGYEGEYVQDRIRYAPWAKERIATAGIPAAAAPPAPAEPGGKR